MEATKTNLTISNGTKIWDGTIKIAETTFPHYAEHIVKCVNSHDELLEAAKAAFILLEKNGYYVTPLTPTMEKLEKAIQKAEGK